MRLLVPLVAAALAGSGCGRVLRELGDAGHAQIMGSGRPATLDRQVGSFHGVRVDGATEVDIVAGKAAKVVVHGDDNIAPFVETNVANGVLRISLEGSYATKTDLRVEIAVPSLDRIDLNGSGNIHIHSYRGDEFAIAISGSGNVDADGAAKRISVDLSGSGNVDLRMLEAQAADVEIDGSGDVGIGASKSLAVRINGSGNVRYRGKPTVSQAVNGSGNVVPD